MKKEKNINQNPCHALLLESKKLHKYDNCWRIESETKKRIIDHLFCYSKECRNGYFHKENLTYWGDVEKIRDNTILLCLLLLGGIKYDENELKEFDVFNDEYNRFIKSMLNVPNGINKFLFQYSGKDPIKVIRLYKRDTISYTKNGEIISNPMTFVRVENFDEADDEVFQTSYDR